MAAADPSSREIDELKRLLFQPEGERLQQLQAKVEALDARLGSPARLEAATSEILIEAFHRAEVADPRGLAAALSPSVVTAIRTEIRNSRDMMVEALYPITGRMVLAAVASAFKELAAMIQQRIDALTSANQWRWRMRAWATGRPVSEIALAEAEGFRLRRLLLIERGSGRLLASWWAGEADGENPDLVSGMIAAITDFCIQAFSGSGELRTLDFGGREVVMRASPRTIIAAECFGVVKPGDEAQIDAAFLALIDGIDHGRPADDAVLTRLAAALQPSAEPAKPSRASAWVLGGVAALVMMAAGWGATQAFLRWQFEQRVKGAFATARAATVELAPFPLTLEIDHAASVVTLRGLYPAATDMAPVQNAVQVAAAPYRFASVVAPTLGPEQVGALTSRIAALEATISQQRTVLAQSVETPEARLAVFIGGAAIFFGNADSFLNAVEAGETLDALAALLKGNALRLRVVGHSDESGGADANRSLSRRRAQAVVRALVERGVEAQRLVLVGRAAAMPISDIGGADASANRRVTFEQLFKFESVR